MLYSLFKKILKPLSYQEARNKIKIRLKSASLHKVESWVNGQIKKGRIIELDANLAFFSLLKDVSPEQSIHFGKNALGIKYDHKIAQAVEVRIKRIKEKQEQDHRNWISSHNVTGLINYANNNSSELTEQWLNKAVELNPSLEGDLCKTFFNLFKDRDLPLAIKYGRRVIELGADSKFERIFETRNNRLCRLSIKGLTHKELLEKVTSLIENGDIKTAFDLYQNISNDDVRLKLAKAIFSEFKDSATVNACLFIKPVIHDIHDQKFIKVAATRFYSIKDMDTAAQLYAKLLEFDRSEYILERFAMSYSRSYCQPYDSKIDCRKITEGSVKSLLSPSIPSESLETIVDWVLYLSLKDIESNPKLAMNSAYALIEKGYKKVSLQLSKKFFNLGNIDKATNACFLDSDDESHKHQLSLLHGYKYLLENGMPMPPKMQE